MATEPVGSIEHAALEYIRQGYAVLPGFSVAMLGSAAQTQQLRLSQFWLDRLVCWLAKKLCKSPLRSWPLLKPITEEARARQWFQRYPDANVMLATGRISGIIVLDVDFYCDAHRHIASLELPSTRRVHTGEGEHYYFLYPEGTIITRRHVFKNHLQGDTDYVVAAPSLHFCGKYYALADPVLPIAPLPPVLQNAKKAIISNLLLLHMHWALRYSCQAFICYPLIRLYLRLRFPDK